MKKPKGTFLKACIFLVCFYGLGLKICLPYLGGWLAVRGWSESREGLPSSGKEVAIYFTLVCLATFAYTSYSEERWQEFKRPIIELLRRKSRRRTIALILFPLVCGGLAFWNMTAKTGASSFVALKHPTPPDQYSKMKNPYRNPTAEMLDAFELEVKEGKIKKKDTTEEALIEYIEAVKKENATEAMRARAFERKVTEEGRILFVKNCRPCHGQNGRGNGTGPDAQKKNAKKERIWPRDLSKPWRYKNGSRVEDIFRTLTGGLTGTPMPSSLESLHKTDMAQDTHMRWAIAYFVESLFEQHDREKRVLEVAKVDGELPSGPADDAWENADEIAIILTGQVTFRPRWQTPAIDFIRVRALYNDEAIAFRLIYNDRTENTVHEGEEVWTTEDTYPELDVKRFPFEQSTYRDAVAIQFPVKESEGVEKPYFIYGSQASAEGRSDITEEFYEKQTSKWMEHMKFHHDS